MTSEPASICTVTFSPTDATWSISPSSLCFYVIKEVKNALKNIIKIVNKSILAEGLLHMFS